IVFEQMRHIRTKNLGYDQDNLMIVPQLDTAALASYPVFREKCLHIAGVRQVSSAMFVTGLDGAMDIMLVEDKGQRSQQLISLNYVTDHFVDLMGMRILAGRDFIPNNKTDFRSHVLINETAVRKLGWEDNPLGREIAESAASDKPYKVVGVIRDFHYAPLNEEIGPMVFFLRDKGQSQIHIKLEGRNISKTIRQIEMLWKEVYPENPFTYSFLDAGLRNTYMHEDKLLKLMGVFTMFSILIALLGLFGLSSYITEKYTREIGIRKVFGASPFTIVIHLSKQYIYLIILACIISMPICWYIMENWLTGFAYRTEINPWWFALTGTTVIIVALCTVIFQSLRAASRNPVEALRYE
ncbi:MAG TPA: FtsX-like permease family protein, partial [Bacteroidales bacterium]|nr:FtsX-like permease family protein [Bacteroidales bacterium]